MPKPVDVCVVGSANLDLVAGAPRHPSPGETVLGTSYAEHAGGKGLNQAVAAARSGATTAFVGAVGDDEAGERLAGVLLQESIDTALLGRVDGPTGRAMIVVDDAGENSIVVISGANALVAAPGSLPPATVVLAQLEIAVATVLAVFEQARAAGATTVLNPAPAAPLPPELLRATDIVVPNEHEVDLIGGVDHLLSAGCGAVVVTRGAAGVDLHRPDADVTRVEAFPVSVVDTTGAGDAFCGSLACRLALGDDLDTASRWASAAGALATTRAGAVPAQPTASAVLALLSEHDR
ncbi:MAG: ribokinase [Ilumatobacter sp.]|nr:ribokinase [Ilumatobacter sp.]